jgi:hypothetical protein
VISNHVYNDGYGSHDLVRDYISLIEKICKMKNKALVRYFFYNNHFNNDLAKWHNTSMALSRCILFIKPNIMMR